MLQRIQSLYLLVVTGLQAALFFLPQATVMQGAEEATFCLASMWYMAILIGITALTAFFTIFSYRRRLLQIRLSIFNCILMLLLQAAVVYMLIVTAGKVDEIKYSVTALFPFVSAVLTYLAIRAIGKDELMVRSLDRIR